MARAVEEITALGRIEIEEDTRDDDGLLLEAGLEEVETVVDLVGEVGEVEPEVECTIRFREVSVR